MSNGVTMSDGGKGSAPRKQQDHEAYSSNYDVIFNRHKRLKSDEVIDKTYKQENGHEQLKEMHKMQDGERT